MITTWNTGVCSGYAISQPPRKRGIGNTTARFWWERFWWERFFIQPGFDGKELHPVPPWRLRRSRGTSLTHSITVPPFTSATVEGNFTDSFIHYSWRAYIPSSSVHSLTFFNKKFESSAQSWFLMINKKNRARARATFSKKNSNRACTRDFWWFKKKNRACFRSLFSFSTKKIAMGGLM